MAAIDFPASPTLDQSFVAGNGVTYKWNGTLWVASGGGASISVSDTPPASPAAGAMWWNSVLGAMFIYYNDGNTSQWVPAAPSASGGPFLPLTGGTLTGPLTGATATFTASMQAGNYRITDGSYAFTPFNGATDTGLVRAGIQFNGSLQTLSFYTANAWRGNVEANGLLNWNGPATFSGAVSTGMLTTTGDITTTGRIHFTGWGSSGFALQYNVQPYLIVDNTPFALVPNQGANTMRYFTSYSPAGGSPTNWAMAWFDGVNNLAINVDAISDERVKKDITDTEVDALAAINALKVRKYTLRGDYLSASGPNELDADGKPTGRRVPSGDYDVRIGLVTQEVSPHIPEMVSVVPSLEPPSTDPAIPDDLQHLSLAQAVPYLIRAIQQLTARVADLEARL